MTDPSRFTQPSAFSVVLSQNVWDFADLVLKSRLARAMDAGMARYPIHRSLRFAARIALEALFDDLAVHLGWSAQRMDSGAMVLESQGLFVSAYGGRKADYCSCMFSIWSDSVERAMQARTAILERVGAARIQEPMFSVDWHFLTSKGELQSASIEEMADDLLHDAAYPDIAGGINAFIRRYLEAPETVLVIQGPPGTGKTRLIRAILGELSRRREGQAQALYTGDRKTLESDEIFVRFITGWEDAFVVEDADHVLKPRAEGNEHLHRFLTIADGVVRSQGRKIIFSTNLPNIGDLDDALVRPGRCFAHLALRPLTPDEAKRLVVALAAGDAEKAQRGVDALAALAARSYSLAEIYRAVRLA